jgi:hypothetical protein
MAQTGDTYRATRPGERPPRNKGVLAVAIIVAVVALAIILFFWLFDVDTAVQGGDVDVDAPDVTTDVNPPAIDAEGGDLPDVDVRGGELPEVDVRPAGEPDEGAG